MIIQENISLADKNWFKTGGNARFFCAPCDAYDFCEAIRFARDKSLQIFVLGEGANILIHDDGFDGLVIRPLLRQITRDQDTITAGAGVSIQDLIDYCLDHQLLGLEEFSGIPGSVGGAVYINIHYFQYLLSHFLIRASVISRKTEALYNVDAGWFEFGYNTSKLLQNEYYLVEATFKLTPVDTIKAAYARGRRDEIIRHRQQRYPRSNTCGSFFRNFQESELMHNRQDRKIHFVAYYLDKIGVKGALKTGNAIVSYQHANMLVTMEGAKTADVILLARTMQQRVYDEFGLIPQPECQFIGFKEWPLLNSLSGL